VMSPSFIAKPIANPRLKVFQAIVDVNLSFVFSSVSYQSTWHTLCSLFNLIVGLPSAMLLSNPGNVSSVQNISSFPAIACLVRLVWSFHVC
jgi:hypothetical protein